jgi:glycosyltransferase involved in cell wall biosynthesis
MEYKYFLSVCVCLKNEANHVAEFIAHYAKQGVDHLYIVDNNSEDNVKEAIENSGYAHLVTLLFDDIVIAYQDGDKRITNTNNHVTMLNNNFFQRVKEESEWTIIVDIDEFMVGKNGHSIRSYVSSLDKSIGSVYVMWVIVLPEKNETGEIGDVFTTQNKCFRVNHDSLSTLQNYVYFANDFGKSILRTSMLPENGKLFIHRTHVDGMKINNYGTDIRDQPYDNCNNIAYSERAYEALNITLHHFVIRNKSDYVRRQQNTHVNPTLDRFNPFSAGMFNMFELPEEHIVRMERGLPN